MELLPSWYAVYTTSRSEKKVKARLDEAKVDNYLPLRTEYRMWSDRRKKVSFPLIPGYIFVHIPIQDTLKVLNIPGIVTFLKEKAVPVPIPDKQIDRLRLMVEHAFDEVEFTTSPVAVGDTILVKQGSFQGLVGELIEVRGKYKIAIRIEYFGCALTTVPLGWVEKVKTPTL